MIRRNMPVLVTLAVLLAAYSLAAAQFPSMLSFRVAGNLLTDNAFLGIVVVGMTIVIVSGGIDLSVGSVIAFTGVFVAIAMGRWGWSPPLAFLVALVIAMAFGAAMGAVIHYLATPPFIVTLAGMFLARGACFLLTTDSIPVESPFYDRVNAIRIALPDHGRLSLIAIVMLLVFAGGTVLLHHTRFGTYVFALGGNAQSAELMGVPVARTRVLVYATSGFLAGLSGLVFSVYTSAGYSLAAVGVELDTIAAVVIGGTLLTGGAGSVIGSLLGLLIQGLIQTYITFEGTLSSWWTKIAIGLLLFVFIGLQRLIAYVSARRSSGFA